MKKVLVVVGHPIAGSFNHALAESYVDAITAAGVEVRVIDLAKNEIPQHPTSKSQLRFEPLAESLSGSEGYTSDIAWAEHVIFIYPQWWGTYPAALKAFIDRSFVSGLTFKYHSSGKGWDKLMTGRTARIVMTMDSPSFWNALVYRDASVRALRNATLRYCGYKVLGVHRFAEIRHSKEAQRARWIEAMKTFAEKDAL